MRKGISAEMAVLFVMASGCESVLSRPVPSQAEYLARYMNHFDGQEIENLEYVYKGAIGGELTVARAQFKGPVQILGVAETGTYDPAAMAGEPAGEEFRQRWTRVCGGTTPAWFDFPFDQKMRMIWEAREVTRDGEPRLRYEWYIDDRRNVVYFWGTRG